MIDCLSLSEDDARLAEMVRDQFTISLFCSCVHGSDVAPKKRARNAVSDLRNF